MGHVTRFLLLLGLAGPCALALAQQDVAVKVRLTVSLARFTQWPPGEAPPADLVRLCVAHRAPAVFEAFRAQAGEMINGRRLVVWETPGNTAAGCHVLFVHATVAPPLAVELVRDAARRAVLTVGDTDGFAAAGGMVELVPVHDAVRFDVNLNELRAAHLVLSSQVLRLARQVRE